MRSVSADGEYKFVMIYQDVRTKYRFLKALSTGDATDVGNHLVWI